tara:strand:- start:312 stop:1112 length:801 start_codon:yes stop_codon:yes gene_type:complete
MSRILSIIIVAGVLVGCGEHRKVLRSDDMQYKYDMAIQYMVGEKFAKAYPLLDELYIMYRGSEKGEKIAFTLAECELGLKDYILASHRYEQFFKNYPHSEYSEDAQFKSAYCNYKLSPKYSLDQTDTYKAIRSFQLFTIQHPESDLIDSTNTLLDELRYKIELKDYKSTKLYYNREAYRAANVAFKNFNDRYPNSRYSEETWFLWYKSSYLLAINSVEEKKSERMNMALEAYLTFVDLFPTSDYGREAENLNKDLLKKQLQDQNQV